MILTKTFRFEASHQLHNHPGKCARLHGHSWVFSISIDGKIDPETGMVMDYGDIKQVVQPLIDRLDHHHLGHTEQLASTVDGFANVIPPTSENILIWFADQIRHDLPWHHMSLDETCTCQATLHYEEWITRSYILHPIKNVHDVNITDDDIPY